MKKEKRRNASYTALTVCAVLCLAAISLLAAERRYSAKTAYARLLAESVTEAPAAAQTEQTQEENVEEEAVDPDAWDGSGAVLSVDFPELISENEDTIGWLHIPAIDVSYPVVYYADNNDYYINRAFDRSYSAAGVIYLECTNDPDLTDPNSLIYGHNMGDGSMFGALYTLQQKETLEDADPYFYIYKPDGTVNRYRIFSCYQTTAGSETFSTIASDEGYEYYTQMALELAANEVEVSFEDHPLIVTLTTCHGGAGTTRRFAVHGVLDGSYALRDDAPSAPAASAQAGR